MYMSQRDKKSRAHGVQNRGGKNTGVIDLGGTHLYNQNITTSCTLKCDIQKINEEIGHVCEKTVCSMEWKLPSGR